MDTNVSSFPIYEFLLSKGYDTYVIVDHTMTIEEDITPTLEVLKEAGVTCADGWVLSFLGNY